MPGPDTSASPAGADANGQVILHASSVAPAGSAVLILGASGSGKSALALELMALGATLVSDDHTLVSKQGDNLVVDAPTTIRGLIEARGVGLLKADYAGPTPLALAVDLDHEERHRFPSSYTFARSGVSVPLLYRVPHPHFSYAIFQFLKAGRSDP